MNIPQEVKVGSMTYKVSYEDEVHMPLDKPGISADCWGLCNFAKHQIVINQKTRDKQGQEQTFCHELAHAIMFEQGLRFTDYEIPIEVEEAIIDAFGRGLHQVILDNKNIFHECTCKDKSEWVQALEEVYNE